MKTTMLTTGALTLSLMACSAMAAVPESDAARLGNELTPIGAEKAGNSAGTIPAWTGGLAPDAAPVSSDGFVGDPYASDQPKFTITAQNYEQYRDNLTPGQIAMLKRYPDTYRLPVFETRRSAAMPQHIYDAAARNARQTNLVRGGNGLENFTTAVAFPIPKDGLELIWNHITRYRGSSARRIIAQATPQVNGSFSVVKFVDEVVYTDTLTDYKPEKHGNVLFYFKQQVTEPSRLAGNVLLVHETLD